MFQTYVRLIFLLLSLVIFLEVSSLNDFNESDFRAKSELLSVHVIFRHGDRSPQQLNQILYDAKYWADGLGQLTNIGKRQLHDLGKWLRSRYSDFLSPSYHRDEIYVASTDVDRTLMSALSLLAGLYPPTGKQVWNSQLLWQPIPVHTRPIHTDILIYGIVPKPCNSYEKSYEDYQASPKFIAVLEEAEPFFEYVADNTNYNAYFTGRMNYTLEDLIKLKELRDEWVCERAHNLPIPEWAAKLYPNNKTFDDITLTRMNMTTPTPFIQKFYSGFLLKDILDRKKKYIEKKDPKFILYSSHDAVIYAFLNTLGVSDNKYPGYAATVIVELRSYKNESYVQLFYKQGHEKDQYVIKIPCCGYACRLEKMYKLYDSVIPKLTLEEECNIYEQ